MLASYFATVATMVSATCTVERPRITLIDTTPIADDQRRNRKRKPLMENIVRYSRADMTDWITHFVHDPSPANALPKSQYLPTGTRFFHGPERIFPYVMNEAANARYREWHIHDQNSSSPQNAFEVLLKILRDGHIRVSWSIRNENSAAASCGVSGRSRRQAAAGQRPLRRPLESDKQGMEQAPRY